MSIVASQYADAFNGMLMGYSGESGKEGPWSVFWTAGIYGYKVADNYKKIIRCPNVDIVNPNNVYSPAYQTYGMFFLDAVPSTLRSETATPIYAVTTKKMRQPSRIFLLGDSQTSGTPQQCSQMHWRFGSDTQAGAVNRHNRKINILTHAGNVLQLKRKEYGEGCENMFSSESKTSYATPRGGWMVDGNTGLWSQSIY